MKNKHAKPLLGPATQNSIHNKTSDSEVEYQSLPGCSAVTEATKNVQNDFMVVVMTCSSFDFSKVIDFNCTPLECVGNVQLNTANAIS
ncbi:hypothetical protein B5X24_HaOG213512 [Helicoverpa armigera]|uniref:Uncharacterized protein n=1 Tax=Helicoverpa armigera TaxID=29058 RepID=A0A2W1BDI8_HELAM|nr:hypothetical protein B5X24_HaOG213512 [Helicoverpa armigera]